MAFEYLVEFFGTYSRDLVNLLLGAFVTYLFYLITKPKKGFSYALNNMNIIRKDAKMLDDITIHYRNQVVENLTMTRLALWNSGNEVIRNTDIPNSEHIRMIAKNSRLEILYYKLIYESDVSHKFSLLEDSGNLRIDFEYVESKKGIVLEILHTGTEKESFEIYGKIMGGVRIKNHTRNTSSLWGLMETAILKATFGGTVRSRSFRVLQLIFAFPLVAILLFLLSEDNSDKPTEIMVSLVTFFIIFLGATRLVKPIPSSLLEKLEFNNS